MSPLRRILALSWPILISQLIMMGTNVVDLILSGHYAPQHLAAVGIAASVYISIYVTFTGILRATSPLIAHAVGAQQTAKINHLVKQNIWLAIILSLLGIALLSNIGHWHFLTQNAPLNEHAITQYLYYIRWAIPSALLTRALTLYVYAIGDTRITLHTSISMLSLKIPLSYLLIVGIGPIPSLGGPGCAMATTIASFMSLLITIRYIHTAQKTKSWPLSASFEWPNYGTLQRILKLGIPIGITEFLDIGSYSLMGILIAKLGTTTAAAHQIIANLGAVLFMFPLSLGIASSILLAQAIGAKKSVLTQQLIKTSIHSGIILGILNASLLTLFREPISRLYTADPNIINIAITLIPVLSIYHIFDSTQVILNNLLRAYQETLIPTGIYISTLWGIGIVGGNAVAFGWYGPAFGATGFWSVMAISLALTSGLLMKYLTYVQRTKSLKT